MRNKKRIYISGCGGMLGESFYKVFREDYILKCTDIDVNEDWLTCCDIRNYKEYLKDVIDFKPDYLFHLGAHTDLEFCEANQEDAYKTNTTSVEYACKIASALNIPLLYIGTAGIFDGTKEVYHDWAQPNPLGVYARTKYLAEVTVQEQMKDYLICRAGWMMGGGPKKDKKFINKIIRQIKNGGKEIFVVNDKLGTPTYTFDFANNVKLLIEKNEFGLYNMVCEGLTSRKDVLTELLKIMGYENKIKVTEVTSDYFSKEYFAPRPYSERLINSKLNSKGLNIMQDWKIALQDYIKNYFL
ncbi:MAG: NAD(P)-dependent oxidoreductase [Bacteroidetes bacterium]|nr:NAD(P)-dependent oxidoreductase [Bacteroidota bacterium]